MLEMISPSDVSRTQRYHDSWPPESRAELASTATDAVGSSPADAAAFIASQAMINGDVNRQLDITLDDK